MAEPISFERSHHIDIDAAPGAVFDFVTNPQSWPKWLAASHHIDSPDRPLGLGETFREQWRTRKGEAELSWVITSCERPRLWVGETAADFIGPIIVRYDFTEIGGLTRFTRSLINPARPKPLSDDMAARIDAEAAAGLGNIKRIVENAT